MRSTNAVGGKRREKREREEEMGKKREEGEDRREDRGDIKENRGKKNDDKRKKESGEGRGKKIKLSVIVSKTDAWLSKLLFIKHLSALGSMLNYRHNFGQTKSAIQVSTT